MKLRIRGDSLRLRLSQGEVASFAERGALEDATVFGPDAKLVYALAFGDAVGATFSGTRIEVTVPVDQARAWATNEEVGIEGTIGTVDGRTLKILVEKDFACLKPRGEDESDNYPHPNEHTTGQC